MGRTSAKRKAGKGKSVHYGSATSQECSHENTDVRLQRRLKRRCTDHQSFNPNSHSSATSVQLGSLGSGYNDSDLRSERRLRRERMSNQCYNPKSRSKASKAIKKNIAGEKSGVLKPASFSNIRLKDGDYDHIDNDNDVAAPSDEEDVYDPVHIKFLESLRRNGNSYSAEFVDENGVTKLIDYDVEEDLRPSIRFGFENQLPAFAEDVDEDDSKHVDEDDLEDVDVEDLEDVDEEYFLTFLNNRNEYSYKTPVSRDKEDDADHCRFIKLKPSQPSGHSNLKHGRTIGNPNLKRGLAADCEQEDGEIEYLTYLDTIEDYENTLPKKSDKVEEIELEDEYDQEDEGDGICEDYHAFLDCLEKEGEEIMFDDDDDDDVQILTMNENPRDVIDIDNPTLAKDGDRSQSQSRFRKELLEILRSPYDPQQHIELWAEVSHRKRKVKDIMLWGGTKSSNLEDSLGESLLDRYKDFAEQMELAKYDDLKTLNLLRGFFYWLKNLSHGVLPPWKDPSLLEVIPRN
ncbi:uncharacterized protein LOC115722130 [Cannabis sativa]|uniref:uncharacterized protein LOC115722130 n=1 Tax=Cannabis sativa TaxID=3483 RepID=UPI0029CA2C90|nr:uncharacterized protein LOC115722130 [Cannabis sativa]XP_030507119.2 uncharacterized protein LOC115722130 [Cannabis sativa]